MPASSFEHAAEARQALHAIVSDARHGIDALSRPQLMANLLTDLLPDAPRETGVLVAAARAGVADTLREHIAQGLDASTAANLAVASLVSETAFTADACAWVTAEFAIALGLGDIQGAAAMMPEMFDAVTADAAGGAPTAAEQQSTMAPEQIPRSDAGSQPAAQAAVAADGVPPMPLLKAHELWFEPHAITDGERYSIGWLRLMPANGGPRFVTLRKTVLGTYKVIERFPLTDGGWSAAWQALADLEPATAERVRRVLARRVEAERQARQTPGPAPGSRGQHLRPTPVKQQLPAPVDELTRLATLFNSGLLTREEFDRLKARLIN